MEGRDAAKDRWRCPECGRQFRQRTREHSCDVMTLSHHLDRASPEVRDGYQAVIDLLSSLGPFRVVPVKTMIVLTAMRNFGGITVRKESLDLGFFLERALDHARVHKSERLSPRKYAHHVRVAGPQDVDSEIAEWLREAYALGQHHGPK